MRFVGLPTSGKPEGVAAGGFFRKRLKVIFMQIQKLTAVAAAILALSVASPPLANATDGEAGGAIAAAGTVALTFANNDFVFQNT